MRSEHLPVAEQVLLIANKLRATTCACRSKGAKKNISEIELYKDSEPPRLTLVKSGTSKALEYITVNINVHVARKLTKH